jgi:plastocyanin
MPHTSARRRALRGALVALLIPVTLHAGQIRVTLNSSSFSPASVQINAGDHVVWVWATQSHTVTSGNHPDTPSGLFDSDFQGTGSSGNNMAFSWKSAATGNVHYFCAPHFDVGMVGSIQVVSSGAPVADFRITEVQYNAAGGADLIEITNLGTAAGDLGRYRIAIPGDADPLPLASLSVAPDGVVVIHPGQTGTNDANDVYVPNLGTLPDASGSVALYVPNQVPGQNALTIASQLIDFVQWGAGGQANEATAAAAGVWTAGTFLPTVAVGRAIEFCGAASDRGVTHWAEIRTPNLGGDDDCATPAASATWGRIKVRYR